MNSQPSLFKLKVYHWGPTKNLQFSVVLLFSGPDLCAFSIQSLCPRNSLCINTPGSYTCVCQQGYYDVSSIIKPVAPHPVCNGKLARLIWWNAPFFCSVEFVSPLWPKGVITQTLTTWKWRCIGAVTTVAPALKSSLKSQMLLPLFIRGCKRCNSGVSLLLILTVWFFLNRKRPFQPVSG